MKVRLCVDHDEGTLWFEAATRRGFREALAAVNLLAVAQPGDSITFPTNAGTRSLRADRIDRADLTWEA